MKTPAAAPSQPLGGIQFDIVPQSSPALAWITFGGSPGESSGDFIQAIQRVAFQQGHTRDDGWIADYTSTCFNGKALQWYLKLDDETQESWKKRRIALLGRFPATSPSPTPTPSTGPPKPSASWNSGSPSARNTTMESGCIEVIGGGIISLGYLYLDSAGCVGITRMKANALAVSFAAQPSSEPFQISSSNSPADATTDFPNLGLALLNDDKADPDQVPEEINIFKQEWNDNGYWDYRVVGIPFPSAMCKAWPGEDRDGPIIATWTLSLCGDSKPADVYRRRAVTKIPSQRAAAAVWKYKNSSKELRITWLMDDGTECELAAYVQENSWKLSLHLHRAKDMGTAGRYFEEAGVRFVLQPTE